MKKINKYLIEWEKKGFISQDHVKKILGYENQKHKKPWIMYGFIMLGVAVLSIGVISLIAANWSGIPPAVKLTLDLLLLILIAFGIYRSSEKNKPALFDALASLFVFLYLASIGLVSQIYHTGGQLYQALFLLSAVSLPITFMSYKRFLPHIWTAIFLLAVILFCSRNLGYYESNLYFISSGILFSLPFICVILGNLAVFSQITNKISMPFITWSVVFYFTGVIFLDFIHSIFNHSHNHIFYYSEKISITPYYIIVNISLILAIAVSWLNKKITNKVKVLTTILACIYCFFMNFFMYFDAYMYEYYKTQNYDSEFLKSSYTILKFTGPLETIISLFLFSLIFSSYDMRRLFNLMMLLIGARFLIIYFQVFESLTYTGFGLIISGLLIIGIVIIWYKYSAKIEKTVRGLLK